MKNGEGNAIAGDGHVRSHSRDSADGLGGSGTPDLHLLQLHKMLETIATYVGKRQGV